MKKKSIIFAFLFLLILSVAALYLWKFLPFNKSKDKEKKMEQDWVITNKGFQEINVTSTKEQINDLFFDGVKALTKRDLERALKIFDSIEMRLDKLEVNLSVFNESEPLVQDPQFIQALSSFEKEVYKTKEKDAAKLYFYLGRLYRFKALITPTSIVSTPGGKILRGEKEQVQAIEIAFWEMRKALELDHKFDEALFYLATIDEMLGDYKGAVLILENLMLRDYTPKILARLALNYCGVGKFHEAETNYSLALKKGGARELLMRREIIEFELKKIELLKSVVGINILKDPLSKDKPFDGLWKIKIKNEDKKIKDTSQPLYAIQNSNMIHATDNLFNKYTGFCYGKWFVLGSLNWKEENGCSIKQMTFFYGDYKEGLLEGKKLTLQTSDTNSPCQEKFSKKDESHFIGN
ncbi:MAG: hypothetical protein A3I11_00275 [Elusimicrobia bacterium RIFCSPLOWO2_02_FULL_39_32]|nr:MAG: hypothetical protein A2034_02025 [Elusimicrobia bacterium GWA2_38_7]OGR81299.1 MAG: hypothetical protein A3B80_03435 [Elusimicrobia bacterium RIFCSPHIGHO2_02_FULL_39_36]OGR91412.1 MAG: hypothetical protein A3I11_00275 [Elusimicrobia bacterium RIFCSPLOWO2_02_FULL_39_32]OGR98527.1 MAG: hypothetical protein A3G85_07215 [Elusimicrobia bacterium RIFCSPLOWO2_12_FULL_39_28]